VPVMVNSEELKDDVGIWRYMDIGRFLALICDRHLYFARPWELHDPWEGRVRDWLWPEGFVVGSAPAWASQLFFEFFGSRFPVNCWHENEIESVAMWKLYTTGAEGVALKSTVARLAKALEGEQRTIVIDRVRYAAFSRPTDFPLPLTHQTQVFVKGPSFSHEKEVRAAILSDQAALSMLMSLGAPPEGPAPADVDRLRAFCRQPGETSAVDLPLLIERIR
jgi:hypothetical protein